MPRRDYAGNAVDTRLAGGISASDLSISILDAAGWPSGGASGKFIATIDRGLATEERILVLSRTGTTLTLDNTGDRGVDDTTAATHSANATIEHTFSALDADEANAHIFDGTRDDHGQYLNIARHDVPGRHQVFGSLGTPGDPADTGTSADPGDSTVAASANHVHEIGVGSINASNKFVAGVVNEAALGAGAVTENKLGDGSVTSGKLGALAVIAGKLADGAIDTVGRFAAQVVDTAALKDGAVTAVKMATNSIATASIQAASVTMAKIASEASTSYVPTFTGAGGTVTLGTGGTTYGKYFKFGRLVCGVAGFTLGTGGNVTGDMACSVPVAAAAGTADWIMAARATGTSGRASGMGVIEGGSSFGYSFATIGAAVWNATSPFNWDQNDIFRCVFLYEAAA